MRKNSANIFKTYQSNVYIKTRNITIKNKQAETRGNVVNLLKKSVKRCIIKNESFSA